MLAHLPHFFSTYRFRGEERKPPRGRRPPSLIIFCPQGSLDTFLLFPFHSVSKKAGLWDTWWFYNSVIKKQKRWIRQMKSSWHVFNFCKTVSCFSDKNEHKKQCRVSCYCYCKINGTLIQGNFHRQLEKTKTEKNVLHLLGTDFFMKASKLKLGNETVCNWTSLKISQEVGQE